MNYEIAIQVIYVTSVILQLALLSTPEDYVKTSITSAMQNSYAEDLVTCKKAKIDFGKWWATFVITSYVVGVALLYGLIYWIDLFNLYMVISTATTYPILASKWMSNRAFIRGWVLTWVGISMIFLVLAFLYKFHVI